MIESSGLNGRPCRLVKQHDADGWPSENLRSNDPNSRDGGCVRSVLIGVTDVRQ